MESSCIYYTSHNLSPQIMCICQEQLKRAWKGEIISVSLKPIDFGKNIVLNANPGFITYNKQILTALEAASGKYVFFCEHDVLYHPSHFDFTPERDDVYYYNVNNWRWRFPTDMLVTYDNLTSLSGLCCSRELAIKHYKYRLEVLSKLDIAESRLREPRWARRFGYEPGTKKMKRGGITDEDFVARRSKYPNIDIRHQMNFTPPKTFLFEFKHPPTEWTETTIDKIPGWELRKLFNL